MNINDHNHNIIDLPYELLSNIIYMVNPNVNNNLSLVCKTFKKANENVLKQIWQEMKDKAEKESGGLKRNMNWVELIGTNNINKTFKELFDAFLIDPSKSAVSLSETTDFFMKQANRIYS